MVIFHKLKKYKQEVVIILSIVMYRRYYIYFIVSNVFFHYAEAKILGLYNMYTDIYVLL